MKPKEPYLAKIRLTCNDTHLIILDKLDISLVLHYFVYSDGLERRDFRIKLAQKS